MSVEKMRRNVSKVLPQVLKVNAEEIWGVNLYQCSPLSLPYKLAASEVSPVAWTPTLSSPVIV